MESMDEGRRKVHMTEDMPEGGASQHDLELRA